MPEYDYVPTRSFFCLIVLACAWMTGRPPTSLAQQGDEEDPFLPGLVARYQDRQGHVAARLDQHLSFHWGETPPDTRLQRGEFRATWQGHLIVLARGDYR